MFHDPPLKVLKSIAGPPPYRLHFTGDPPSTHLLCPFPFSLWPCTRVTRQNQHNVLTSVKLCGHFLLMFWLLLRDNLHHFLLHFHCTTWQEFYIGFSTRSINRYVFKIWTFESFEPLNNLFLGFYYFSSNIYSTKQINFKKVKINLVNRSLKIITLSVSRPEVKVNEVTCYWTGVITRFWLIFIKKVLSVVYMWYIVQILSSSLVIRRTIKQK
jgi:hypothetical protein